MTRMCFVATDAISFNVLYRGQLEYISQQGHELTLICGGSASEIERLRARGVGEVIDIGLVRPPRPLADLESLGRLIGHFMSRRYDLIVVTTPKAILLGAVAAWAGRQPRRVAFFRGRVYENYSGIARTLYRALDKLAACCVHESLFVSHSLMAAYTGEVPALAHKGKVLGAGSGNGVCASKFSPQVVTLDRIQEMRARLEVAETDFVVLVVGRICVDKGIYEIGELVRMGATTHPDIKFVFVGPMESGIAQAEFERLQMLGNVVHVPFTADVVPYFALANVHLFLSHREGFGNVAIEAAAMGLPTIAFDVVGVRDSVVNGITGVRVPFGDTDAVYEEIVQMRSDPHATAQKYAGARQWVMEHFAQERVWKLYGEYYAG